MTAPLPTQPDRLTVTELRAAFANITERLDRIESDLANLRQALATAPKPPAESSTTLGETITFDPQTLLMSYDDTGQPIYKAKGGQYQKFGVRIWPEVLPTLGVDPASLKPGPNPVNLRLRVLMGDHGPRKVIGIAI